MDMITLIVLIFVSDNLKTGYGLPGATLSLPLDVKVRARNEAVYKFFVFFIQRAQSSLYKARSLKKSITVVKEQSGETPLHFNLSCTQAPLANRMFFEIPRIGMHKRSNKFMEVKKQWQI